MCSAYSYLLVATDPNHGKLTKMLCVCTRALHDATISTREYMYGPLLYVGGEILQLTREDRNDGRVHFATVCALQTERW